MFFTFVGFGICIIIALAFIILPIFAAMFGAACSGRWEAAMLIPISIGVIILFFVFKYAPFTISINF